MLKYIIFLRLLSQDFVTKSHIKDAELLIKSFITEYESLYGKDFMSYNTHAHLHLPAQSLDHWQSSHVFLLKTYSK